MQEEKKYTLTEKESKVFFKVIDLIEAGNSVRKIFEKNPKIGVCRATFKNWIRNNKECVAHYARATSERADILFDEIMEISDNTIEGVVIETDDHGRTKEKKGDMLGHRKLQIDSRKWILAKMNPKKYGDKLDVTSDNERLGAKEIKLFIGDQETEPADYKEDENKSTS